jgi:antitoxin MazE
MKGRLVRIGNSRGVRLAKAVLEEAGLTDEVEIRVRAGAVVITAAKSVRAGWREAALRMAKEGPGVLDEPTPTRFQEDEWEWK